MFGKYASALFFVGLFGSSFSSLLANATLGGAMLGDALGFSSSLNSNNVRLMISLVMISGSTVAITFGRLPLELIVLAQSVTIFLVPFIGIAIFVIASSKSIMGQYANNLFYKIAGMLGLGVIFILMISNVYDMFLK